MKNLFLIVKTLALSALLASSAFAAEKVNINTADAGTLDRVLIGVGPSKAEAIVVYRKQNGAFRSADQLTGVKGIGLATVEKNRGGRDNIDMEFEKHFEFSCFDPNGRAVQEKLVEERLYQDT